jgi:hypothetical protein
MQDANVEACAWNNSIHASSLIMFCVRVVNLLCTCAQVMNVQAFDNPVHISFEKVISIRGCLRSSETIAGDKEVSNGGIIRV